jgi:Fe2+ or Zn2+ uptake regulation protein
MPKKTRLTKQKGIIEKELTNFKTFFTADELLQKAKAQDEKIGIATIYRFLKDKIAKDEIHSYYCDRRQVYSTQKNNHCHFICSKCGKTTHFNIKDLGFIKDSIQGKICHFQIDINGICDKCSPSSMPK